MNIHVGDMGWMWKQSLQEQNALQEKARHALQVGHRHMGSYGDIEGRGGCEEWSVVKRWGSVGVALFLPEIGLGVPVAQRWGHDP